MLNRGRLSIGMEELKRESKYPQELISIRSKLVIIQKPERW